MKKLHLIDKAFILKRTPFFSALDLDLLLAIADKVEMLHLKAGQLIFAADQEAQRLYIIAKGTVLLNTPEGKLLAELHSPELFGDEALFCDGLRGYEAISQTDALLLTLSRTHLAAIISECPAVALGFLHQYAAAMPCRFMAKAKDMT